MKPVSKKNDNQPSKEEDTLRGVILETDKKYVLRTRGKEALLRVEEELKRQGVSLKYDKVKTMSFYPIKLRLASLQAIKKVCGLSDEQVREMGFEAPKFSLIVKLFAKYFSSVSAVSKEVPTMWRKHYTVGELMAKSVDEKKRRAVLCLKGMDLDPLVCIYLSGYFSSIVHMVTGTAVTVRETKCVFRGEKYHEYSLNW